MFQGCPTMQRLAAANGLVALVGSESSLIQVSNCLLEVRIPMKKSPDGRGTQ